MKKQIITLSMLVIGFLAGASALSAIAGWSPASIPAPGEVLPCTAPKCNTDAPINVSLASQIKAGTLGLNSAVIKGLQILTQEGTSTTNATSKGGIKGKVLTAIDTNGNVGWRGGWVSIPLNDSTSFDKECSYRVYGLHQAPYTNFYGTDPVFYIHAVDPLRLTINAHDSQVAYIKSTEKTRVYDGWNIAVKTTDNPLWLSDIVINKIEKYCY